MELNLLNNLEKLVEAKRPLLNTAKKESYDVIMTEGVWP